MANVSDMVEKLIDPNGLPRFGIFERPVEFVNYRDFDLRSAMDRPCGKLARWSGFKQFQFVGLCGPELVMGCAVVDLKWVGNAFFYLYDPVRRHLEEFSFLQPLGRKTSIDPRPDAGRASFARGNNRVTMVAEARPRVRSVQAQIGKRLQLEMHLEEPEGFRPLAICTRSGYQGWTYTQKAAGLPVRGCLQWDGREFDLGASNLAGSYDWSCGYMRRETFWNWGCLSGRLPDGRWLGLNIAAGVNETGFTECGFWLDHRFTKLDMVNFHFDRLNPERTWTMTSHDGLLDLRFEPEGTRRECRNFGLLASNFKQVFGKYYGSLRDESGETIRLDGLYGFAEDHYAKW
ncbi:DUF2804 domain-containing protein [Sulfidibacter corallicola]|uniref:DUF2804 domain-containing protein n=1 Tax=Sulfidibacter corallicola TaxID=2818388 RepID=A0A8A4TEX7_SULCO|nr:DUF2804 domain-containing protein [Sulfidibacter corallicola]QTD47772.1 DUF2804 domain-containing protein [Sulfidibacter corallicola]